jgi:LCP family protein required for cell wall assembly
MNTRNPFKRLIVPVLLFLIAALLAVEIAPAQAQDVVSSTWDGESRYTVLIVGLDRRPNARDNLRSRTDVIILASIDPKNGTIGLLSIPRDMHFAPADSSVLKPVNTLMVEGEDKGEGFGPYYLMETLQINLGMYIDAYIAFDFEAFIALVDAIGGVEVEVPYTINDPTFPDMNYGYDPFYINRGLQQMDGRTALKYVRTRHADNDYARGERQLQVLQAVREKLSDPVTLNTMVGGAPELFAELESNIYSDIKPQDLVLIGLYTMNIPPENIKTGAINLDYSFAYATGSGVVRVPDHAKMAELLTDVFGETYWEW